MSILDSVDMSSMLENQFIKDTQSTELEVLTDIYQENTNIVVWKRSLADKLIQAADILLDKQPDLEKLIVLSPNNAFSSVYKVIGNSEHYKVLAQDIAQLVDIFCRLFDIEHATLKLTALDRAMCPRFHVDRVPCRMITTYHGAATEWLPHHLADRSKLGTGNKGKPDEFSGIFERSNDIRQLSVGDVALLKGELWYKNEGAGLIHRSPQLSSSNRRLLLTIDFIDDSYSNSYGEKNEKTFC